MKEEDIELNEDFEEVDDIYEEETTVGELLDGLVYFNETHKETYTLKEYLINVLNYDENSANEISSYYNLFMNYS